ncbi:MAG: YadA-like family protein [Cardiobacteriaceae bacterium]|nr:YadA-like family protein [Cardiobacteriaceae bacterium]
MNHIYKSLYNKALGTWVAVPEIAKTHGKSAGGKSATVIAGGKRFACTALASALLLASGQVMAASGNKYPVPSGNGDNYCYYDTTSQSVLCGDDTTSVVDTYDTKQAKSVAIGKGAQTTGESNVALGASSSASHTSGLAIGAKTQAHHNQTIAIGENATSMGETDIMIGKSAGLENTATSSTGRNIGIGEGAVSKVVKANNVIGIGTGAGAEISGTHVIAIGTDANRGVKGTETSVAVGYKAMSPGVSSVAVGNGANSTGTTTVAVGFKAATSGNNAVAVGNTASAGATSVAVGVNTVATQAATIAVGSGAKTGNQRAIAIGENATGSGSHTVSIGRKATSVGTSAIAIGGTQDETTNTQATGHFSIALGSVSTQATADAAMAIGKTAIAASQNAVVIGNSAHVKAAEINGDKVRDRKGNELNIRNVGTTTGNGSVAIGMNSTAFGTNATAVGQASEALGQNSFAGGQDSHATGKSAVAIGDGASSSNDSTTSVGPYSKATAAGSSAYGFEANASGDHSLALGSKATAAAMQSTAIGREARATVNNGVALGSLSVADVSNDQVGADPLEAADAKNNSTWTATHAAVSVGNGTTVTRQITSVAAGTKDTDAVNVAQLKAAGFKLTTSASTGGEVFNETVEKVQNGETVTIDAGENIKITQATNKITVATKQNVTFNSVTAGTGANQVVLNNDGVKTGSNVLNGDTITVNGAAVTNVNSAINQVAEQAFKPLTFNGNTGSSERKLGQTVTISGGLPTTSASSNANVHTVVDSTAGTVDIRIADNPVFAGKVTGKGGLDAGGNKVTNVAKGEADTDAVNKKQLEDALAKANLAITTQVDSNSPFAYVNEAGDVLIRNPDGSFYKADDPTKTPYTGKDITISALNPGLLQTAVPAKVGNVAKGTKDTDAVNVSQLKGAVDALGGGASLNPDDGTFNAPSYIITATDGTELPAVNTVAGALQNLNNQVVKPLIFGGDTGAAFARTLGSQVDIKGGAKANLTENNIGVHADNGTLTVKLAKDVNLGNDGSLKAGNTTVNNAGITLSGGPNNPVQLTNAGLNNGGNKITNVAAGEISATSTDAVNGSQLYAVQQQAAAAKSTVSAGDGSVTVIPTTNANTGSTNYAVSVNTDGTTIVKDASGALKANTAPITTVAAGKPNAGQAGVAPSDAGKLATAGDIADAINNSGFTLTTAATANGEVSGSSNELVNPGETVTIEADKNIKVTQAAGKVSIATKDKVEFTEVKIGDANHNTVLSSTPEGLSVGGDRIVNVAAGKNENDAVNVKQLKDEIARNPGTIINNTYVVDNTTVSAGKGIKVTQSGDDYNVALADDVVVSSLNAGPVTVNKDGLTINNNTYVDANGLNANGQAVRNVAAGRVAPDSMEAVNGAQLHALGNQLGDVDKRARAGIASAMASAGLPQAYRPGANMVAASAGHYDGQTAIAIGASTISDNGRWILKGTLNVNSKDAGATVGIGYQW